MGGLSEQGWEYVITKHLRENDDLGSRATNRNQRPEEPRWHSSFCKQCEIRAAN